MSDDAERVSAGAASAVPWRTNAGLFVATIASVFLTGLVQDRAAGKAIEAAGGTGLRAMLAAFTSAEALKHGAQFTGALLSILVAHELGHFIAARIHKVDASLPYFIPMPILSPFGTMGAVIRMRGVIPTRRALLDIGASGPLAGLAFAIPMYLYGLSSSRIVPADAPDMITLGESLLLKTLDRLGAPHVPAGMELELSPIAFAAWAGMFVTMINLLPVGQLDGGHVAYALFGPKQDRYAQIVHRAMLAFFALGLGSFVVRDLVAGNGFARLGQHVGSSIFWLVWFEMLAILGSLASRAREPSDDEAPQLSVRTRVFATLGLLFLAGYGREHSSTAVWLAWFAGLALLLGMEIRGGALRPNQLLDHPPTGAAPLDRGRAVVAIVTLLLFVSLFMPTPMAM